MFCITFKANQSDFNIYSRKHTHDFRVTLYHDDFENAVGLNLDKLDEFMVCKKNGHCLFFD